MESNYYKLQDIHWRKRYDFVWNFYINVFFSCVAFSIVMPSIWKYIENNGGTQNFLASVLFAFSLGEFIGALFFGYLHNYTSTLVCLLGSRACGLTGSFLYFFADFLDPAGTLWVILISRFIQGLWTGGQQSVESAYISEVVADGDKIKVLSELGISAVIGFIIGPLFGSALSFINIELTDSIRIDQFTSPGYLQFIVTIVMIVLTVTWFKEIPRQERPGKQAMRQVKAKKPNTIGIIASMLICLFVFNGFAVQQTITTPLVTDSEQKYTESFDWSVTGAYLLYGVSGVLTIITFFIIKDSGKYIEDRTLLLLGMGLGAIGWIIMIDYVPRNINLYQFFSGYALVSVSFPIGRNLSFTMISKIIGPHQAGGYMGWMLAIGAVARMLGPFWAVQSLSQSVLLCFGGTAGLLIFGICILGATWIQCEPHSQSPKIQQEDGSLRSSKSCKASKYSKSVQDN